MDDKASLQVRSIMRVFKAQFKEKDGQSVVKESGKVIRHGWGGKRRERDEKRHRAEMLGNFPLADKYIIHTITR